MKIGIFDSGLGGLIILKAIRRHLPRYDYVYLGDTKRLPYGSKTVTQIYTYASKAVDYLFRNDCEIIIVACNTVSSEALRKLQREYLPQHYPDRRILGVIVPTVETVIGKKYKRVGIIGTKATVASKAYITELRKLNTTITAFQKSTPQLVPLIEKGRINQTKPLLRNYISVLRAKKIDALILGCTHYCLIKKEAGEITGKQIAIITQDDIIPKKLADYLKRHGKTTKKLSKKGDLQLLVTKKTSVYTILAKQWFGKSAVLEKINVN